MGECAVVAHCRVCGAERMVIAGRGGMPYGESPAEMTTEARAKAAALSEKGRQAALKRKWRPARVGRFGVK